MLGKFRKLHCGSLLKRESAERVLRTRVRQFRVELGVTVNCEAGDSLESRGNAVTRTRRVALMIFVAVVAIIASAFLPTRPIYEPVIATAVFLVLSFFIGIPSLPAALAFSLSFFLLVPILFSVSAASSIGFSDALWESMRALFSSSELLLFMLLPVGVVAVGFPLLTYVSRSASNGDR